LINIQIDGLKQRMAVTLDNVKKERHAQGIATLEEKLDDILFNCTD
jgi:D-hexose-6-phosphate mutarotase